MSPFTPRAHLPAPHSTLKLAPSDCARHLGRCTWAPAPGPLHLGPCTLGPLRPEPCTAAPRTDLEPSKHARLLSWPGCLASASVTRPRSRVRLKGLLALLDHHVGVVSVVRQLQPQVLITAEGT